MELVIRNKVFMKLLEVPKGKVVSYGELAHACGTSARAVGAIMRSNDEPHIYPCYKVVHENKMIGNYSGVGGKKTKIKLLKKDGVLIDRDFVDEKCMHRF